MVFCTGQYWLRAVGRANIAFSCRRLAGDGPIPFLFLGAIFVVGGTLWSIGQAVCAASATRTIRRNPALLGWLERLSGCVYIALGLNLLRSKPQPA